MLGASMSELVFTGVLVALVLLAQVAPRLGEMLGARFGGSGASRPGEKRPGHDVGGP